MEGPSLVITKEELSRFIGRPVRSSAGFTDLKQQKLLRIETWGKHLILIFSKLTLRIHFLMFGSYRINHPRENRDPKLEVRYANDTIYFYSCAIRRLEESLDDLYDWSSDLMSPSWSEKLALKKIRALPTTMICDVLMDQDIFSGLGNIMKNEILFRLKLHPEQKVGKLSPASQRKLVKESRIYSFDFYEWKKKNVLKKNWLIMRKKKCPVCGRAVMKRPTGKLQRLSHYCSHCQKK